MQPKTAKSVELQTAAPAPQGVPATQEEMSALTTRRGEIQSQLKSWETRSNKLVENLKDAPSEARAGMTERLNVMSGTMVKLESELATINSRIAAAPRELLVNNAVINAPPPTTDFDAGDVTAMV